MTGISKTFGSGMRHGEGHRQSVGDEGWSILWTRQPSIMPPACLYGIPGDVIYMKEPNLVAIMRPRLMAEYVMLISVRITGCRHLGNRP